MTTIESESRLREAWERAGQAHVFRFWPELSSGEREQLLASLRGIDLALLARLGALARDPASAGGGLRFETPSVFTLERRERETAIVEEARERGRARLGSGRIGYLLVAGGQASRLGHEGPKGTYPVGPVTGQSLFELFARRLLAAWRHLGARPAWYVMTSQANDAATRDYFEAHGWFGLAREDVYFFSQAMLPALDREGRVLLATRSEVFLAPNGHGGTLMALHESGALEHARERGIETFSYFQVDNPLALPADPLFLGLHARENAQMSSKVVAKRSAEEKVGVLGRVDGRLSCIEYSDLPAELREARDARGRLAFDAGNIAVHALERAFVEELTRGGLRLPWHVARKSIQTVDAHGRPTTVEGHKFETFVFDALSFVDRSVTLEVARAQEFSPVKNRSGEDSADTARAALCALHADWVRRARRPLPPLDAQGNHPVEVDPLLAEDAEGFAARASGAPLALPRGHYWS